MFKLTTRVLFTLGEGAAGRAYSQDAIHTKRRWHFPSSFAKVIINSWIINITFMGVITAENASILDLEYLACASPSSVLVEAFPYEVSYGA